MSPPPSMSGSEPKATGTDDNKAKASLNEHAVTPSSLMSISASKPSTDTDSYLPPTPYLRPQYSPIEQRRIQQIKREKPSSSISPTLPPKINPSITPLLPDQGDDTELVIYLASKSNYENLLSSTSDSSKKSDGNFQGSSYSLNLSSKRTSHKIAEQGRRNRINVALQEIRALLPADSFVSPDIASEKTPSTGNSKASTVEAAIEYIKVLKEKLARQEHYIAPDVLKVPRESTSHTSEKHAHDDKEVAEFVAQVKTTEDVVQASKNAITSEKEGHGFYVEQWQESTEDSSVPYELGILGRLTHEALKLYKHILQSSPCNLALSSKERTKLKRYYDMFVLWANEHNVLDGTLDRILQTSGRLQRTTLEHLTSVSRCLAERLFYHVFSAVSSPKDGQTYGNYTLRMMITMVDELRCMDDEAEDEAEEWSKDDSLWTNVEVSDVSESIDDLSDILEDLKTYIQCLVDLGTSLENTAPDADYYDEVPASIPRIQSKEAHQYYADIIRSTFPLARSDLIEFLGRENWCRYQRLQAEWSLNSSKSGVKNEEAINWPVEQENAASVMSDPADVDSGLGTSLRAPSIYGISTKSVFAERNLRRILEMSNESKEGYPFPCSVCGKTIILINKGDLRTHLFEDLQPYICIYDECKFSSSTNGTVLKNRQMWSDHFETDSHQYSKNAKGYECALCLEVYESSGPFAIHLAEHLENIALTTLS